jgi:hypothetical protein
MTKPRKLRLTAKCAAALAMVILSAPATGGSVVPTWDAAFYQNTDAYLTQNRNVTLAPFINDASPANLASDGASGNAMSFVDMLNGGADGIAILGTIILYFIAAGSLRTRNRNLRSL